MTAGEIIGMARRELKDGGVRWTDVFLLEALTAALRALILLRPDANARTESIELAGSSTRQAIPAGGFVLLDVVRNMGDDGETPGSPITVIDRSSLDDSNAGWHSAAGSDEVDHFAFDDRNPEVFYVTPPPNTGRYVEIAYSVAPVPVQGQDDELPVSDSFAETLLSYLLYRAYRINNDSREDWNKARDHLRDFFLLIGEEKKARALYSPNTDEHRGGHHG